MPRRIRHIPSRQSTLLDFLFLGEMILEIHAILSGQEPGPEELRYLYPLR